MRSRLRTLRCAPRVTLGSVNKTSSLLHRLYNRLLKKYRRDEQSGRTTLFKRTFEHAITLGANTLIWWHRFEFPERKTGGWWWISRFRFEFLAAGSKRNR